MLDEPIYIYTPALWCVVNYGIVETSEGVSMLSGPLRVHWHREEGWDT